MGMVKKPSFILAVARCGDDESGNSSYHHRSAIIRRSRNVTVVARFEVHHSQFLDADGKVVQPLPEFARDPAALLPLYRWMTLMRIYDAKAIALQRTGQLGTFASLLGKEAVDAGVGTAMAKDDVLLMTYRENGVQMIRGVTLKELFLYWGGDEQGSDFAVPRRDFPVCITISAHITHAVGVA